MQDDIEVVPTFTPEVLVVMYIVGQGELAGDNTPAHGRIAGVNHEDVVLYTYSLLWTGIGGPAL